MTKKILWLILTALFVAGIYYHKLIGYGLAQARGQFVVLWNAQPIDNIISQSHTPDSVKFKLKIINEIRAFAFDSLGLTPSKNYTTYYDQKGKDILWVVTACAPYKFEPVEWTFPIIGSFTYKGFFELRKALSLADELMGQGYDVEVSPVSGWSTLGWFKDPVLSKMTEGTIGSMANTIIHELTHGTIFVPDSMTFNENLASFVGRIGGKKFLEHKYGNTSEEVKEYEQRLNDSKRFTNYMILGAKQLDNIYRNAEGIAVDSLKSIKVGYLASFTKNIDTVEFTNPNYYLSVLKNDSLNNARFISFLNYRERQNEFEYKMNAEFDSMLSKFVSFWKTEYPK